jgi:diguanylate cyclase (GGDEF)-like protein
MIVNLSSIIPLIAFFFYSGLVWVILSRNLKTQVIRSFTFYLVTMIVWSLGAILVYGRFQGIAPLFWTRFMAVGLMAMPIAFYGFTQTFLMQERRGWIIFGLILYLLLVIADIFGQVIPAVLVTEEQVTFSYGTGFTFAWIVGLFFIGMALVDLVLEYRKTVVESYRNQIRYLLITILLILFGFLIGLVAPTSFPIDVAFSIIAVGLIYYAILKHELLDISIIFRKSMIYTIPLLFIGAVYFLIIYWVLTQFKTLSGMGIFLLSLLVTLVTIFIGQPVYNGFKSWIERVFFRDRYNSAQMLQRLSHTAASVLDLDVITQTILKDVTATMHIRNAGFFLKNEQTGEYYLTAQVGMNPGFLKLCRKHPLVTYFEEDHPFITNYDLEVLPQFLGLWKREREELESTAAQLYIPLKARGDLVGIFTVGPKVSGEPFTHEDQLSLNALADQTAAAIKNALLFTAESRRRQEAETLQKILSELTSDLELQKVLNSILVQLEKVVSYDSACVFLVNKNRLLSMAARGFHLSDNVIQREYPIAEDRLFQELQMTRRPVVLLDVQGDTRLKGYGNTQNIQNWMGVPLILRGTVIGCLTLDSYSENAFSNFEQVDLIQTFASHAAVAVENARLFKVEREQRGTAEALREVGTMLSSTLDFERVLDLLLDQIGRVLPYDLANIMLSDDENQLRVVRTRLSTEIDPSMAPWIDDTLLEISDAPNLRQMVQSTQPKVISDLSTYPGWIQKSVMPVRSWAGAPVFINNKLAACFSLVKFENDFYTSQHTSLLSVFSGQAALALQNAHLFKEVQELAIYDDLTGIFNRRHLYELGKREFNRAQRFHRTLAVVMMDLDYFRNVNDEYGHAVGDQILRLVSERCKSSIREVDVIGRYGGDEFTIVCPEAGFDEAQIVSERLRKQISRTPFITTVGPLNLTASMGIAVMTENTPDLAYMVDVADKAMYVAKHHGRDLVCKSDEIIP